MRVLIIGAGALGGYYVGMLLCLRAAPMSHFCYDRGEQHSSLNAGSL